MQKFENVDVLAALEQIMRQHTAFYQNDFDIDKDVIRRDAASDQDADKPLLWMARPSGTYCFRERDVFLKGTRQHNTWKFYGEQTRDKILAYAVELTGTQGGTIRGNLYELDYQQHFRHVVEAAQPVSVNRLFYDCPGNSFFFNRYNLVALISCTRCTTSNNLGLPDIPYDFKDGVTARQIVFSVRLLSATTKFVSIGSKPRSIHSTDA